MRVGLEAAVVPRRHNAGTKPLKRSAALLLRGKQRAGESVGGAVAVAPNRRAPRGMGACNSENLRGVEQLQESSKKNLPQSIHWRLY